MPNSTSQYETLVLNIIPYIQPMEEENHLPSFPATLKGDMLVSWGVSTSDFVFFSLIEEFPPWPRKASAALDGRTSKASAVVLQRSSARSHHNLHNLHLDKNQPKHGEKQRVEIADVADFGGGSSQHLDTWLITMVTVSFLRIGLWDPFHMAELHSL